MTCTRSSAKTVRISCLGIIINNYDFNTSLEASLSFEKTSFNKCTSLFCFTLNTKTITVIRYNKNTRCHQHSLVIFHIHSFHSHMCWNLPLYLPTGKNSEHYSTHHGWGCHMYQYIQIWLQFIYLFMACLRTSVT